MPQPPYLPQTPYRPPFSPHPSPFARQLAPQPPSYQRAWHWYRSASRSIQVGIGLLVFVLLLCIYVFFVAISMATHSLLSTSGVETGAPVQVAVTQDTATPTAIPTPLMTATSVLPSAPIPIPTLTLTPTPTLQPQPSPTSLPLSQPTQPAATPTPTPCSAVACNPWGYNFVPGSLISSPPRGFCSFFPCIANFWSGHGYVVQCHDGQYSKLGGTRGACASHNGVLRTLYAHTGA